MRNRTLVTAVIVAVMAMSLYMAGCGGGGGKSVSDVTNTNNTTTAAPAADFTEANIANLTAHTTAQMGVDGTQVTTFTDGTSPTLATFLDMATCATCHKTNANADVNVYDNYLVTNHNVAWNNKAVQTYTAYSGKTLFGYYKDSVAKTYCVNCHTVNSPFYDTDGDNAYDAGEPVPFGLAAPTSYADYSVVPTEYKGIQCENCHGPASLHAANSTATVSDKRIVGKKLAGRASTCMYCHKTQYDEWVKSGHSVSTSTDSTVKLTVGWTDHELSHPLSGFTNSKNTGNCSGCHSGDGFVKQQKRGLAGGPYYCGSDYPTSWKTTDCAAYNATTGAGNGHYGVTCATCHDPHNKGQGSAQLRLANNQLCAECHNGRYREYTSSGVERYDKTPGAGRGIHPSAQSEMQSGGDPSIGSGSGAVEPTTGAPAPYTYSYSSATNSLYVKYKFIYKGASMGATCTDCHMYKKAKTGGYDGELSEAGHTFKFQLSTCTNCHSGMNAAAVITAKQHRATEKFEDLEHRFGLLLASLVTTADTAGESGTCAEEINGRCCNQITTGSQTRDYCALIEFNIRLVETDPSKGVHNEPYVNAIYEATDKMLKTTGY